MAHLEEDFMKGNHVMRHRPGIWNGVSSDLFIESKYMRYGKGQRGIVAVTLQPGTLRRWALGFLIFSQLKQDVEGLSDPHIQTKHVTEHKEEGASRIYERSLQ